MSGTIGGTGAAAIVCQRLGVRYFGRGCWDAYLRFTGEEPPWEPSTPMRNGLRLENAILDRYAEQRPGWAMRRQVRLTDGHRHGTLDGLLTRERDGAAEIVDAKRAVMRHAEWGTAEQPATPVGYIVQLAWYALRAEAAGHRVASLALAIYDPAADAQGWEAFHVRYWSWPEVRSDAAQWQAWVDEEHARWVAGERPELDGSDAAAYWLALHCAPPRDRRDERPATTEEEALVERWRSASLAAKRAEAEKREAAQRLIFASEGKRILLPGGPYVQPQAAGGGRRLDSKLVKARHPAVYAECCKETQPAVSLRGYRFPDEGEEE